jgi:hypothetical protein
MKHSDHAIITPTWTHSYESHCDFRRSSPGFAPGFERTGRTPAVQADLASAQLAQRTRLRSQWCCALALHIIRQAA